ncbi:hybrid sensor histidine kinase/response regulator [Pedobacter cryotolerans]|uniref:histidine kinase n=1 Tax=Pedobacter cryotolerans TaxID=2571270 RepID=A0A4U1CF60_9SPHI|nr:ATP-binding protein [Pedobacter cryotolerans]TKC03520.1 response regulator [Pedobacter cryotolerans]
MVNQKRFIEATKGKIIIGFLLACFALLLAWGISKFVFGEMLNTVEQLSAPNNRLRIVNELSHQTARLDQLQKDQAFNNDANKNNFILKTRRLRKSLDTLSQLYERDTAQLLRIKSIKKLLADRDKQFLAYLKVRETLVNTKSFSNEVKKLNELVSQRSREADSAVLTTRTSTSTTTIAPEDDGRSKGFLNRLFGKKKAEVYKIIDEEFQVKRDTLNAAVEDSVMMGIESSLLTIEKEQQYKSNRFLKKEAELANASNLITQQMLTLLREVEAETVAQIDERNTEAKDVVGEGIIQITIIIVVFFLMTLILGYWILKDIGKSNRYRIALEEAKEEAEYHGSAKQRFLSNMSHEIRTPLQSILGYSELIMREENPNPKHIKAIHSSSTHLLQIVNEVLDYNRIISGKFSFNPQDFNMAKLLDEVTAGIIPLADKKQIKFIRNISIDEHHFVNGDPFRLKQILFNVLGNAVKFTVNGSVIFKVTAKQTAKEIYFNFIVEDTGIGFDDANVNVIFKEFEQIEKPAHHIVNKEGTGLGLAIVKELVDNQGGRIEVKSTINVGTTFSISLKYNLAEENLSEAQLDEPKNHLFKPKVWVIDDDLLILELCALIFTQHQVPFAKFSTAAQCLNASVDDDIKYVLLDMRLPDMYGLDLFALLKEKMPNDVKFYAITAQVLPNEKDHVIAAGLDGLITKPFKASDLLSIFDETLVADQVAYDLNSLERMTMGDKDMLAKILIQFKKDCLNDIDELRFNVDGQDVEKARLIIHRLAGRIAQIGANELGTAFRILEQEVADKQKIEAQEQKRMEILIAKLNQLIDQLLTAN